MDLIKRTGRKMVGGVMLANTVSALPLLVVAIVHLSNAEFEPLSFSPLPVLFGAVVPLYFVMQFATAFALTGALRRRTRFLVEDRPATEAERWALIMLPSRVTKFVAPIWVLAAVGWISVNAWMVVDAGVAVTYGAGSGAVFAGAASSGFCGLVVEAALRPLVALANAGRDDVIVSARNLRRRLLMYWFAGSASYLGGLIAILAIFPTDVARTAAMLCCLLGLPIGFGMSEFAARSITHPLAPVRDAMARVRAGEFTHVDIDDGGDLGLVQAGFNRMVNGLKERDRLRDLFDRRVGAHVAARAVTGTGPEGTEASASILFVDVIGSTTLAAERTPDAVVTMLNALFASVVRIVDEQGGTVNRFQGDRAVCVFGVPTQADDHAGCALRAARALRAEIDALGRQFPGFDAAIGVSTGRVVAGDVGTTDRYEYTVIGDPANEAARLTDVAKGRPGRVLVSHATVAAGGLDGWIPGEPVTLRGRPTPTQVYEPVE